MQCTMRAAESCNTIKFTTKPTPLTIAETPRSYNNPVLANRCVEAIANTPTLPSSHTISMTNQRTDELTGSGVPSPTSPGSSSRGGSAATTPVEAPKVEFQFLNFSHPEDAKTSHHRKKVRSHVTKQQHQREQALTAARRARNHQDDAKSEEPSPLQHSHAAAFPFQAPSSFERKASNHGAPSASTTPSSQSTSPSTPSADNDLIDIYPPEWHSYIPRIMDHWFTVMAVADPDVDGQAAARLARTVSTPFIRTDPATLHATMLIAASHYSRVRGSRSHTIDLLQLRGMAISEINGALADDKRGTSDQLIMAVAIMAAYEALFGDRAICETHMRGLTRMVSIRGGLPALGLDGFLERIVLWVDSNVSHITNRRFYFEPNFFPPSIRSIGHTAPDLVAFSNGGASSLAS